jgi:DNA-binding transcriptional regulator YdaS (Cro superfamily)
MNLRDYLHFQRITTAEFARRINYYHGTLNEYMRGRVRVSKRLAEVIEKATNGEVTAKEVLEQNPELSKLRKPNK